MLLEKYSLMEAGFSFINLLEYSVSHYNVKDRVTECGFLKS